jgi:hypothetical protein
VITPNAVRCGLKAMAISSVPARERWTVRVRVTSRSGSGWATWTISGSKVIAANRLATTIGKGCGTAAAGAPPDLTGSWSQPSSPTTPAWQLVASGPGLRILRASWHGSGAHSGLVGSFQGRLSRQGSTFVYSGNFQVSEGSVRNGGTMTFTIVSKNEILMSYRQGNGSSATNQVFKRVGAA